MKATLIQGDARHIPMADNYDVFLKTKVHQYMGEGISVDGLHPKLYPFQAAIVKWALRKGRSAIFADCGLGKTFMQLEWANHIPGKVLIVAPLSVAQQTQHEAEKLGLTVPFVRAQSQIASQLSVTNYEMLDSFDPSQFKGIVLDESSILKSIDGKTRDKLIKMFRETPYRLCCTATPAPNDIAEIANHAEFLGIMTRAEMLASFFVHDDTVWRLKGHAIEPFFKWLASWGMSLHIPSDLGFEDNGYILPRLEILPYFVDTGYVPQGMLFSMGLDGIHGRLLVRRQSLKGRVDFAANMVNNSSGQWLVWCGLNKEGQELAAAIPDSRLIEGANSFAEKAKTIEGFLAGDIRVLVTKPRIAGFGMNFQRCHQMIFVGLSDSYEAYYHCVRRCWRFGQSSPVTANIVLSAAEEPIYRNIQRKETQALELTRAMLKNVREYEKVELASEKGTIIPHIVQEASGDNWTMFMGDCTERLKEITSDSIDFSVFSPPFLSLYTYMSSPRDLGNSQNDEQFFAHFGLVAAELLRVIKPGRNCAVHVAQVPAKKMNEGYIGLKDFRGDVIRCFQRQGWIYHGEVTIDKNPQSQAIRTHSKGLLFAQLKKDSSWLRPGLADYICIFRKPGENAVAIHPDIGNEEWITFAHPVWYGIRETDTLSVAEARSEKDERHVAPLQLETIERCIRLWSNPNELVLSPFAGIGSEGYKAILLGRRFIGIELKPEYWATAVHNLQRAEEKVKSGRLL